MSDPQDKKEKNEDPPAETTENHSSAPETRPAGETVLSAEERPNLKPSAEMEALLAEAEAVVEKREKEPKAEKKTDKFDPNAVEPAETEPAPPPPTPQELELKLQILDLRAELREKEKELEKKIQELRQNAELVRQAQKRLEDYKLRVQKEKADWFNYGHEPLLKELLLIVDNLERALAHAQKEVDPASLTEGVALILRQFQAVLAKFGVSEIESEGQPFNPEWHQAMAQVENGKVPPNTVLETHQKGYRLKDRLLRPAMVVVSKSPSELRSEAEEKKAGEAPEE